MQFRAKPCDRRVTDAKADVTGVTAITPSDLQGGKRAQAHEGSASGSATILGAVHRPFMSRQVLSEAPWIDVIVRDGVP